MLIIIMSPLNRSGAREKLLRAELSRTLMAIFRRISHDSSVYLRTSLVRVVVLKFEYASLEVSCRKLRIVGLSSKSRFLLTIKSLL